MISKNVTTIPAYIENFPADIQKKLQQVYNTIKKAAPKATEKISYAIPTFYLEGNLVHFAAYKHHIGFYPGPSGLKAYQHEIAAYKHTKGAVRFPIDKPMPLSLITKIVKLRADENVLKAKLKKKKGAN